MNRNDFYKELMSRYALDEEKIRINAIKQAKKPAWQKFAADYWKPAVGTAAAVAVTVAAVAYTHAGSNAPDISEPPLSALSAAQRLNEAEQNYYNLQAENLFTDIYITFSEPVSYNNIVMAFSTIADSGEIKIEALYTEGGILNDTDSVRAFGASHSSEKTVIAAKVSALSVYYRDIQDLPKVYLAELGSDALNDETFAPMTIEDPDPLFADSQNAYITVPSVSAVTTTPFEFDSTDKTSETSEPALGASGSEASTLAPPDIGSGDTDETETELTEPDETETDDTAGFDAAVSETASVTDVTEPVPEETTTVTEVSEPPANEITSASQNGMGASLLTEIYELNVENSLETCLIGNNAVVLTKNAFYMYTFAGYGESQSCSFEMNSPRIAFRNNDMVILTGCNSDDVRNIISVIDLNTDEAHTFDVSGNIGEAGIGTINYCSSSEKFFIKSVLGNKTFVYEASISAFSGIQFRPLVESDGPVSIVGYKNDLLYLAKSDSSGENTGLYAFNCTSGDFTGIASFRGVLKIRRGVDLESFALISETDSYIYDVNIGMLIMSTLIDENTEIVTNGGRTCFRAGGKVYEIMENSQVEQISRTVIFGQDIASDFEISDTTSEKIIVVRKGGTAWIS